MPERFAKAKTLDILKLPRAAACRVARLAVVMQAAHPSGDQQCICEDIQHDLSPFHVLMLSFLMSWANMRLRKPAGL
jgi:hypothetical protein